VLARNLALARTLSALHGARFGLAVWVLYYLLFTDYAGIGLVEAVTLVAAFVLEVPTGVLADRLGRRPTLVLSFAVLTAGYLLLASVQGLSHLLVALVVLSLGRALYSGTFEALLFDSLAAGSATGRFAAEMLRARALSLGSSALSMVAGGFLYARDPRLPYVVTAGAMLVGALLGSLLREPPRETTPATPFRLWPVTASAVRPLFATGARSTVLPLLVMGALAAVADEILDDVLAVELGYGPRSLGLLFAAVYLAAAAASALSGRLFERSSPGRLGLAVGAIHALTLLPSPWIGMGPGGVAIALRAASRSVLDVASSTAVNELVPSSVRATALSAFALLRNAPYIVGAYAVGSLMDRFGGLAFAAGFGGASLIAVLALWALLLVRAAREE
jgi:MFS family permease